MSEHDDTLRMLEDAASTFATFDAKHLRAWRDTPPGFDRTRFQEMGTQGWLSILLHEDHGGLGLPLDAATTVAKQLGRASATEPFTTSGVVIPTLLEEIGPDSCPPEIVADIFSGAHIASLAWQNPAGRIQVDATHMHATFEADQVTLDGTCRFVPVAHADSFFVVAKTDTDLALVHLPASQTTSAAETAPTPPSTCLVVPEPTADGGFNGHLTINRLTLPKQHCIAHGPSVRPAIEKALDYGTLANTAELLGIMERALELTLDYLKTRKQFGHAIGSFQVLQHRTVDLWMKQKVAQFAFDAALKRVLSPSCTPEIRARAASSAKYRVAKEAHNLANESIQLHGAIGFTDEYDLGLYVNRILTLTPLYGNANDHRARISALSLSALSLATGAAT